MALAAAAALVALVPLGRLERDRAGEEAAAGIAATRSLVGANLLSTIPERYFTSEPLVCLLYSLAGRTYSVSLCFDPAGRLVEATDARTSEASVWSVRADPGLATIRIGPRELDRVLAFMTNREAVSRVIGNTLAVLRHCYRTALAIDREASNDVGGGSDSRTRSLTDAAHEAADVCDGGGNVISRLQAAYGTARAPRLWGTVRSGRTDLRALAAELQTLSEKLGLARSHEASVLAGASYRAAFANFAARLRVTYDKLRRVRLSVRLVPASPLGAGG